MIDFKFDYIILPIIAKKYIGNYNRYFIESGVYYSYLNRFTANQGGDDLTPDFTSWINNDYGIIIGVGIDLQVSDEIIMVINLRNNLGLQNISSAPVHNDGKIQNNSLELVFSIGLLDL